MTFRPMHFLIIVHEQSYNRPCNSSVIGAARSCSPGGITSNRYSTSSNTGTIQSRFVNVSILVAT